MNINVKEFIKGGLQSFITKFLGILLNYLLITYLAKEISKESVSYYNISFVILSISATIFSLGMNFSILRLVGENLSKKIKLLHIYSVGFKIILLLSVLGSTLLYFLSSFIGKELFKSLEYVDILKYVALGIPFFVITIFNIEFLRGLKKIHISESIRNISLQIFTIILLLLLATKTPIFVVKALIASVLISFSISSFFIVKFLGKKLFTFKRKAKYSSILKPSIPLLWAGISAFLLSESGMFILEYFYDSKTVGDYIIIYKISLLTSLAYTILSAIISPKISELYWSKDLIELKKIISFSNKSLIIISSIIFVLALFSLNFFLGFFELSPNMKTALIVMLAGQFVYSITGVANIFLMVTNYQKQFRNIYAVSAIINIILCFILIPFYGVLGACISTSLSYIILNFICNKYFFKIKV